MSEDRVKAAIVLLIKDTLLVRFERVSMPSPNVLQVAVPDKHGGPSRYFDIRVVDSL
jgi:hypothetical protein